MAIEMKIKGLMFDPVTDMPIVVLKDSDEQHVLPIWIGIFEADAIAKQLEDVENPRPYTHDLLKNTVDALHATLEKVTVNDLRQSTFYAELHFKQGDEVIVVDSRPSDAMALALRAKAPIFVEEIVLEKSSSPEYGEADQAERLRAWLENVDSEELGNYEM